MDGTLFYSLLQDERKKTQILEKRIIELEDELERNNSLALEALKNMREFFDNLENENKLK